MGLEIERKFLLSGDDWRDLAPKIRYRQGYINADKERTVRVRTCDRKGFLTVKGLSIGASRLEFEYEIPLPDAEIMLAELCEKPLIEKDRTLIRFGRVTWEVDEFLGENSGLIIAEVELEHQNQAIDKPDWVGKEVTGDPRYFNSNLIRHPYSTWK
ncbi:MAG: adenylate cyclase [Desulfocapsa sp.]|nr:MAG: adenylate cyclase [Desulfocapsa sp.]